MSQHKDIFKIRHNNLCPEKGKILIAEPFLQNAYFQRSVVLLVEHNAGGSMGFVLNKQTDLFVNNFFPELERLPSIPIYLGGPVHSTHLFFIHSLGENLIPSGVKIGDRLFFDGEFEALKHYILSGNSIEGKVKFFVGYSGWTKNQLDCEIMSNSWLVSHSTFERIMQAHDDSFWNDSVKSLGTPYSSWINYPKNPEMN